MSDGDQIALEFLRKQLKDLEVIHRQATNAVNAFLAKEQFQKWKKHTLTLIAEKVGPTYAQRLSKDWLETAFQWGTGGFYEELADDIDMCVRHLKKIIKEIETKGIQEGPSSETQIS